MHRMTVGTAGLGFGERAIRCAMTMTDQVTGQRRGPEPLRTLADYRREPDGVSFGLKATVLTPGHVTTGDPVTVTACASRWTPRTQASSTTPVKVAKAMTLSR